MASLTQDDLVRLIRSVFPRHPEDRRLAVLVDVPRSAEADNRDWQRRRALAAEWVRHLNLGAHELALDEVRLLAYPDVGSNSADLPQTAFAVDGELPGLAAALGESGSALPFVRVFESYQLYLAPTEFSTTAPLKNAARQYGFRAATMPGFSERMLGALRLDYDEVSRRVELIGERLDRATSAEVLFAVDSEVERHLTFDLRFRTAHRSAGRFPDQGTAGNLPSGESYIVPYEGERAEASQTAGVLPVQLGDEVLLFTIEENRVTRVEGSGAAADAERQHVEREPAYGNMAELGFGVLGDLGLEPVGEILLDEKLGLHVAFGRSDHFGGRVGPRDFSSPAAVIHLDRIYVPALQPRVAVRSVDLIYDDLSRETIITDGRYLVF
jgi:hypothetical protein